MVETRRFPAILALVALSTVLRLTVAASLPPALYPTSAVLAEEQWRGTVALEVARGPLIPFLDYQGVPFHGGPLVLGLLASPLFLLFGSKLFVLKLVPLAFNAAAVALVFLLLDRRCGRRAAWLGGLLFATGPPSYALLSTVAYGTHVENNALILLVLCLALGTERGARRPFVTGAAAGFATYFGYGALPGLLAVAAFSWAFRSGPTSIRSLASLAAGYVAGLVPWFAYNVPRGFPGLELYDRGLVERVDVASFHPARVLEVLVSELPRSMFLPSGSADSSIALGRTVSIVLFCAVAFGLWSRRSELVLFTRGLAGKRRESGTPSPVVVFALQPALFLAAYLASGFTALELPRQGLHGYRYFAVSWPFVALAAAVGLDGVAARSNRLRRVAWTTCAALTIAFGVGTLVHASRGHLGRALTVSGHLGPRLGEYLAVITRGDLERLGRLAERIETRRGPKEREQLYFTLGQRLKDNAAPSPRNRNRAREEHYGAALDFLRARVAPEYRPYFERPVPGERSYDAGGRERFWSDYEARAPTMEPAGGGA